MLIDIDLAKAAVSTYSFTTTFFKDPTNPTKPWKPNSFQRSVYDIIDFGYDVEKKKIKPKEPVEIVLISCPRQVGKSEGIATTAGALAIRYSFVNIGVMLNNQKNSKKFIRRIFVHIERAGLSELISNHNSETIEFTNGSIIDSYGMTENVRFNSYTWLIIDEAAQFSAEVMEGAAIPTTRTAGAYRRFGTPSVILMSTPRGTNGRFADMFMKGIAERGLGCRECKTVYQKEYFKDCGVNWYDFWITLNPPNDRLRPCACGANNYEYVDKDYSIVRSDPYEIFGKEAVTKELARRGGTPLARQELLGEFLGAGQNVFRREWLDQCMNPRLNNSVTPLSGIKYYMGVDFGKNHDATVFCVVHEEDGVVVFDWIDLIQGRGHEYNDIRIEMMEHISKWKPIWVIPDATGMGNPICEQLESDIKELRLKGITMVKGKGPRSVTKTLKRVSKLPTKILSNNKDHIGFLFDMNSKPELIDNLQTLLSHAQIEIPHEQIYKVGTLWEELIGFGYDYTQTGKIKYGVQHTHDDTVIALALACWGVREKPFIFVKAKLGGKDTYVYTTNSSIQAKEKQHETYSLGFGLR